MKVKFLSIAFSLSLIFLRLSSLSAQGQDKGLSPNELTDPNHSELNLNDDKTLLFEHESKPKGPSKDSVMIRNKPVLLTTSPAKSKPSERKPVDKEEDDALSFNFLYYIIQKFKISDLIDE